jgi:hypothetical protein
MGPELLAAIGQAVVDAAALGSRLPIARGELLMGYSRPQTRPAGVPLPAEIDVTNARQASRDLLGAFIPGSPPLSGT